MHFRIDQTKYGHSALKILILLQKAPSRNLQNNPNLQSNFSDSSALQQWLGHIYAHLFFLGEWNCLYFVMYKEIACSSSQVDVEVMAVRYTDMLGKFSYKVIVCCFWRGFLETIPHNFRKEWPFSVRSMSKYISTGPLLNNLCTKYYCLGIQRALAFQMGIVVFTPLYKTIYHCTHRSAFLAMSMH